MSCAECSICKSKIDSENAPILAVGGYGNPRFICEECADEVEAARTAIDYGEIEAAMAAISEKLKNTKTEDTVVIEAVNEIFAELGERAKKIKDGTYDFSLDSDEESGEESDGACEIPEELLETEEDRALDKLENERARKADKIINWISIVLGAVAVSVLVFFLIKRLR